MAMNRLVDITDFSREGLREALNHITFLSDARNSYKDECVGQTVVNAFFEKDRNTELAFRAAATRLGADSVSFDKTDGESLRDAVMTASAAGDLLVISHPKKGAARAAALYASIPVVNAGDGGRAYPVKTLSSFASVWIMKKHISNLKVGFLGDFADNPLSRGLLQCLNIYKGNEFYFISVNGRPVTDDYINIMDRREKPFVVYDNIFEVLPQLDVLYMTKVERSSFENDIKYEARKHKFTLDEKVLLAAKEDLIILHDFPRGEELDVSVDSDPRARYFDEMNLTINTAMTIIIKMISKRPGRLIKPDFEEQTHDFFCGRDDCITSDEKYLPPLFHETEDGKLICKYCGHVFDRGETVKE